MSSEIIEVNGEPKYKITKCFNHGEEKIFIQTMYFHKEAKEYRPGKGVSMIPCQHADEILQVAMDLQESGEAEDLGWC